MKVFFTRLLTAALLLFPLTAGATEAPDSEIRLRTVVIDAGHGGKDAGAVSKDRKTYEKNVVLDIAKRFGEKIQKAYPDVKVIYTRSTDKFVELNERAAIANRNKADLFISIHINANNSTSPSGFSSHVLGQSSVKNRDLFSNNLELCRRENAVILLEDDYDTAYQGYDPKDPESFIFFNLMQNAYYEQSILFAAEVNKSLEGGPIKKNRGLSQDPFLVLWKTSMPAVLLELGFISNPTDLKVLNSESGREQIAQRLMSAFTSFKKTYDSSLDYSSSAPQTTPSSASQTVSASVSQEVSASTSQTVSASDTRYGIQIMTLSRKLSSGDPALKGLEAESFQSGGLYRYVTGLSAAEEDARQKLSTVRKTFPDAYLVKVEDGQVSRL